MSELTREEALQIAAMYGLTTEIKYAIGCGQSPEQALRDWDIIKEDEIEIISGSEDKIPPAATNPDVKDGDDVEIIYREERYTKPNEETKEAIAEARADKNLKKVDMSSFENFIKSCSEDLKRYKTDNTISEEDSLTTRICKGLQQVKLIEEGELPSRTIEDLLDEL